MGITGLTIGIAGCSLRNSNQDTSQSQTHNRTVGQPAGNNTSPESAGTQSPTQETIPCRGDPPQPSTWNSYKNDGANRGYIPTDPISMQASIEWERRVNDEESFDIRYTTPVIQDGTVFSALIKAPPRQRQAPDEQYLVAVDSGTGDEQWRRPIPSWQVFEGLAVSSETVVVASGSSVIGFHSADGSVVFERENLAFMSSALTVSSSAVVHIGVNRQSVIALDPHSGEIRWTVEFEEEGIVDTVPAVMGRTAFVALTTGEVCAVDIESEDILWRRLVAESTATFAAPTINNCRVFVADETQLYALDSTDGTIQWQISTGGIPSVSHGTVYLALPTGGVLAVEEETGRELWVAGNEPGEIDDILSPATVSESTVYVCDRQGRLFAVNRETGEYRLVREIGSGRITPVADGEGLILATESSLIRLI